MVKETITIVLYYIYVTGKRKKSLLIINAGPKHLRKIHQIFNCLVLQKKKQTNQPKTTKKIPQTNTHTNNTPTQYILISELLLWLVDIKVVLDFKCCSEFAIQKITYFCPTKTSSDYSHAKLKFYSQQNTSDNP